MQKQIINTILPAIFIGVATFASAQKKDTTLNREVEVVKSFTPELMDVHKINDVPKIEETEPKKPVFNYSIDSKPVESNFAVTPLKAATIETNQEKQSSYGFLKGGIGNYNRAYGEFFFNQLISQKSIFGLHAKHTSSNGSIKLEGGDKVEAPFSDNQAEVYYNQFFNEKVLALIADYDRDAFNYYGYPKDPVPPVLLEDVNRFNLFGTKQVFSKGGITIKLNNPAATMKDRLFGFDFDYHYFQTKTGQDENYFQLKANWQQPINIGTFLVRASASYNQADSVLNRITEKFGSRQQTWLYVNPAIYFTGKMANFEAGINLWYVTDKDMNAQMRLTPKAIVNFVPVKNTFKMYIGLDGSFIDNRYSKIAYENPFVDPYHDVINSFERIRFYGGIDGKIAPGTKFKIGFDYSMTDDQPFYYQVQNSYIDSATMTVPVPIVNNDFYILYDNINRFRLNAELFYTSAGKLDLSLKGNYYVYNLDEQKEAWNLPEWDATLSAVYGFSDRLNFSADFYFIGQRKALIKENVPPAAENLPYTTIDHSYNLKTVFDLNIKGNYKFTDKLSGFAQLNNFGFQKYERWYGYPVQSFNFLVGASYSF